MILEFILAANGQVSNKIWGLQRFTSNHRSFFFQTGRMRKSDIAGQTWEYLMGFSGFHFALPTNLSRSQIAQYNRSQPLQG